MKNQLETSKKRISNGKWSYRNYIIKKEKNLWKVIINEVDDALSQKISELEPQKSIKKLCLKIDEILGELPKHQKSVNINRNKKTNKDKKTQEKSDNQLNEAKKIAYEFRWELANKLNDDDKKLTIPFGKGEFIKNKGFKLSWNKKFEIFDDILNKINEKYNYASLEKEEKEEKLNLYVYIDENKIIENE